MPITPPLDMIPALPNQAVGAIQGQLNKLIGQITSQIETVIKEAATLPDDITCDDPRIQAIKEQLEQINDLIGKIQEIVPIIDKIVTGIKTAVSIAAAVKSAIFLIPVVGTAALQAELMMVQNMTIANSITAVKQLTNISPNISAALDQVAGGLAGVVNIVSQACDGEKMAVSNQLQNAINDLDYSGIPGWPPGGWLLISGSGECGSPSGKPPTPSSPHTDVCGGVWLYSGEGYNNPFGVSWGAQQSRDDDATMGTEFYTQTNVSIDDLKQRLTLIDNLVEDQKDLLTSLQEAPAQAYSGAGRPSSKLGKIGDYYIDTQSQIMYGPKKAPRKSEGFDGWPMGVNY